MMYQTSLPARVKKQHMTELAAYKKELYRNPRLAHLFIEMTALCNEHCIHCGSRCGDFKEEGLLSGDEIRSFLDYVKKNFPIDRLQLCITGGEPLLRKDFFEIMEYARFLGFAWGMTSNGILITPEVARELKRTGMRTVSISVDGLGETHDWFRGREGSYEETMTGIRNLLEVGFDHVQITSVIHKNNIHQLDDMYETFCKTGVRSWRAVNIEPIGRAKEHPELLFGPEEYKRLLTFIKEKRFASTMEVAYGCSHYLGTELEREVRPWYFLCNAGIYTAAVTYNGDITACLDIERRPELVQGNIRKDDFKTVWQDKFQVYRNDSRCTGMCKKCKEYKYCGGDSFHTWDFDKNEPGVCLKGILF